MLVTVKNAQVERMLPPGSGSVHLEGLYLAQNLRSLAEKLGKPMVIANYVTDIKDVIAAKDANGEFQVAREIKNPYDWRLFQELTAQADILITGGDYLERFKKQGEGAQNVLTQFETGGSYESLGNWRIEHGYEKRSPDLAIPSRGLSFEIPPLVAHSTRRILLFTTKEASESENARRLKEQGAQIVVAGEHAVEGRAMIEALSGLGYKVIKMTTGPRVLALLLDSEMLDRLYITQVQREIAYSDPSQVLTVLGEGKKIQDLEGFTLTQEYVQKEVALDDGMLTSQRFLLYEKANPS